MKLHKGDEVVVLAGKDIGKRGTITTVLKDRDKVIVTSTALINVVKRHQKPNPQAQVQGGIIEKEMPLAMAKVAIWNPAAKKADRVGFKSLADGKKVRFFKSTGEVIDA